ATVLGADPDLDIAVLQIQARPLQAVPLADSNDVQVGDFVVAIGNPFGLGQTVTTGIVSALGRSGLGIEGFENFIQTDASINPGNSGGALVNLNGELVGINTAILAPSGGNVGIGFAIPINMAKASLNQIVRYGEVKRGQIGISVQDLTPMLREAFALPPGQIGVLIADVIQGSNAEQVGLQAGDIILKIDGQPVMSANQLRSLFATYEIGKGMTLTVVRNGNERAVKILVEDPNQLLRLDDQLHPLLKGVTFAMNRDNRLQIDAMQPNSRAAYAGLRPGDIVLAVNQVNVKDLEQLQRVLAQAKGELLIKIARNNRAFYAVLR
ncbi:MAG: PDZ domain-containing protein, partial [Reinekea sp.]|nr:PDZ domain-containing protein [Reinekea sp.]